MAAELSHSSKWGDIRNALDVRDQMGWQYIQHLARIGSMLIQQQGDMSLREFIKLATEQDQRLTRSTVHRYETLHRNMPFLEQHHPATVTRAIKLIEDHRRPAETVPRMGQPEITATVPRVRQPEARSSEPISDKKPPPQTTVKDEYWHEIGEDESWIKWIIETVERAPTYQDGAEFLEEHLAVDDCGLFDMGTNDPRTRRRRIRLGRWIYANWRVGDFYDNLEGCYTFGRPISLTNKDPNIEYDFVLENLPDLDEYPDD